MELEKKRVGCLYRVSTKKQVNIEDDIPMQRNACMEFIKKREEWELNKEYIEPGVSGYHKGLNERKVLQEVIKDVGEKNIDVLLVFMFDRLGRKDDETPFLLKRIVECGVEVWSVCEGQQTFENSSDNLMNIIRFWGASTESKKTAARVDSGRNYKTKQGKFTGGIVPYGFTLIPTGQLDRKGRMINEFTKEPFESEVVQDIYNKLIDENMSLSGLIAYLNEDRKLKTRKGNKWNTSTVRSILKNPLYKGYMSYGKTRMKEVEKPQNADITKEDFLEVKKSQRAVSPEEWILAEKANPDYVIVSEERWQLAQEILARRYKKYTDNLRPIEDRTWKSPLLLVGLLECGYCHGKISPAVSSQKVHKVNGEISRSYTDFYKCNTRGRNKKMCAAKSYISRYKLEASVLEEVNNFLDRVVQIDCSDEVMKNKKVLIGESQAEQERLECLKIEYIKTQKNIEYFKQALYKAIIGEGEFDSKYINEGLKITEDKDTEIKREIEQLEKSIQAKQLAMVEYLKTIKMVPVWREVFEDAPLNVKKKLLSILIENIIITGNEIDIHFKIDIDSFLNISSVDNIQKKNNQSMDSNESYRKMIEEKVVIEKKGL